MRVTFFFSEMIFILTKITGSILTERASHKSPREQINREVNDMNNRRVNKKKNGTKNN